MRRNTKTIPQDPKSKEAQDARDVIVGDKDRAQLEMLDIAKKKKELIKEIEALEEKSSAEIEEKRKNFAKEVSKLEKSIADLKAQETTLNSSILELSNERETAENLNVTLQNVVRETRNTLAVCEKSVAGLQSKEKELNETISGLKTEIDSLATTKSNLNSDVYALNKTKLSLEQTIIDLNSEKDSLTGWLEKHKGLKVVSAEEINKINSVIEEKTTKLDSLNKTLGSLESQITEAKEKIRKTEEENSAKIKNLVALEQRVDAKIEIFKQYKDKFSVDELAKMKINTNLS